MIAVLQRVARAEVSVEGSQISSIGYGLLILFCMEADDEEADMNLMVKKCSSLRIFPDAEGVMNLSVKDVAGEILCVSQFTLAASVRKGNRPSYIAAARPEVASPAYDRFCRLLSEAAGTTVRKGIFGADMQVSLVNDGPVTIIIDTHAK